MALLNARSLAKLIRRGDRALQDLIEGNDLDVLLVTETWLRPENDADVRRILPEGYDIFHVPRTLDRETKRGGGVAIICRTTLNCERESFHAVGAFEYVAVVLTPPGFADAVLVMCVYRPPSGTVSDFSQEFLWEFNWLVHDVYNQFRNVIIGGDFNIWVDSPSKTVVQLFNITKLGLDLQQHVSRPTHNRGHTLDLILTNPYVRISDISEQENMISDHKTVFFTATLKLKKN